MTFAVSVENNLQQSTVHTIRLLVLRDDLRPISLSDLEHALLSDLPELAYEL